MGHPGGGIFLSHNLIAHNQRQNILETPHYGCPPIYPIVSKLISGITAKSSLIMIGECLDEKLVATC